MAGHGIGGTAAHAPEEGIERPPDIDGDRIGSARHLSIGVGEQQGLGLDDECQLIVLPERVNLGQIGHIEAAVFHADEVGQ